MKWSQLMLLLSRHLRKKERNELSLLPPFIPGFYEIHKIQVYGGK